MLKDCDGDVVYYVLYWGLYFNGINQMCNLVIIIR